MKEKFDFVYNEVKTALEQLKKGGSVEKAKATASLLKQANNVLSTQLDAAKFMSAVKDAKDHLEETGLVDNDNSKTT